MTQKYKPLVSLYSFTILTFLSGVFTLAILRPLEMHPSTAGVFYSIFA